MVTAIRYRPRLIAAALFAAVATAAHATPISYDAVYRITTAGPPNAIYGDVPLADTFHASIIWDWDAARGAPDDTRMFSTSMMTWSFAIGNMDLSNPRPDTTLMIRTAGTAGLQVQDLEPDCLFNAGSMTGRVCGSSAADGLFIDEMVFNFSCADWTGRTHVTEDLSCASGLLGNLGFGIKDFDHQGRDWNFHAELQTLAIPEPGTMALLGIGLLGLIASRRRRLLTV